MIVALQYEFLAQTVPQSRGGLLYFSIMILIKDIETVQVSEELTYIHHFDREPLIANTREDPRKEVEVKREMVQGKRFRNANGKDVCIGATKKVEESLGLPFEAFDNMNKTISRQNSQIESLNYVLADKTDKIVKYETATFWERLKYLFTGTIK